MLHPEQGSASCFDKTTLAAKLKPCLLHIATPLMTKC
jgi:hypothetical protein